MMKKKGFTLTEVLLAVMIVAIIGVALASLTTAASRESGVGSSRIVLRNNLTSFLRRLRQDIYGATRVLYVGGNISVSNTNSVPLLLLANNMDLRGNAVDGSHPVSYIAYCFTRGSESAYPSGAYAGGTITRAEISAAHAPSAVGNICTVTATRKIVLANVKYLNSSNAFKVPSFYALDLTNGVLSFGGTGNSGVLRLRLIVEIPGSQPVVNEAVEDIFLLPMGLQEGSV